MSDKHSKIVKRNSVIYTALATDEPQTNSPDGENGESMMEKIPYPKAVFFIIITEFCERFCFYGMQAVLTLYFVSSLKWSENFSIEVYHLWISLSYFTPLLGAILADSVLGKFRTIFYLSIVYACGSVVLSVAATPPLHIVIVELSMVGLALIAVGTGGIKPCVSAFGGDQFQIPGQESQLESYFAIFYFSINCGALLSQIVTPIFREDVTCFGDDTCYTLAFSVPATLMIIALIIFLSGKSRYKIVQPQGNVVVKLLQAVKHSLSRRGSEVKAGRQREHWLDYANDKFDQRFLDEVKVVFKVLFLYIPLPIFWTLFSQMGSRWTLQATRMNGKISGGFGIKPDQMQVINPILVLLFIPLFDRVIYPLLGKCNLLKKPLQRLTCGLFFAGLSFVVSGIIELRLVPPSTHAVVLASGESSLHIVNALPVFCDLKVEGNGLGAKHLLPHEMIIYESISTREYEVQFSVNQGCEGLLLGKTTFQMESGKATTYVLTVNNTAPMLVNFVKSVIAEDLKRSDNGYSKLRIMYLGFDDVTNLYFNLIGEKQAFQFMPDVKNQTTEVEEVEPNLYDMSVTHSGIPGEITFGKKLDLKVGGCYVATVVRTQKAGVDDYNVGIHEITSPTSVHNVHMLWQLPQFVIISIGEIMFSITIMDFSYTEAPPSMKSVMQSAWLMTVAFGNIIVVILAEAKIFSEHYKEFFLFAGIMFVDCFIFAVMAYRYVPTVKFWENDNYGKEADDKD